MELTIEPTAVLLLLIGAIVSIVARRAHQPYTAWLVIAGMILSMLPFPKLSLTKEFLFGILLPPLIFEAALSLRGSDLRRDLDLILLLANHLVELTFNRRRLRILSPGRASQHFRCAGFVHRRDDVGQLWAVGRDVRTGKVAVQAFWEYAAFLANSPVFLLIGIQEASQNFRPALAPSLIGIGLVLLARAAAVYNICSVYLRSARRLLLSHQNILFRGGLRESGGGCRRLHFHQVRR